MEHLYIHIPFCDRRCQYCDFYSETGRLHEAPWFSQAVINELSGLNIQPGGIRTVYLGGGTPVLIGADPLNRLLLEILPHTAKSAEITIEANPRFITPQLARDLKSWGVNRVSLGAQTFDACLRRNLGRAGSSASINLAMNALRQAGHTNVAVDMIYGIPGQTLKQLRCDIEAVMSLRPEHISYYGLTIKEGSAYWRRWQNQLKAKENEDLGRTFYETVASKLEGAGYRWYETSNFCLPGHECRHNLAYWQGSDYMGLGPGAYSTLGLKRWQNIDDLSLYLREYGVAAKDMKSKFAKHDVCERGNRQSPVPKRRARIFETLSISDKLREKLLLGLRCDEGVACRDVAAVIDESARNILQRNGFLASDGDKIFLTRAGRFVANEVSVRLLKG